MIDVKSINNIIEATVHGEITKTDIKNVTTLYKEKITKEEPINLLLVMEDMKGITIEGIIKDMEMVKYLNSLKKVAIVGDKTWLEVDAKVENLMPGVEVENFDLKKKEIALDWLKN